MILLFYLVTSCLGSRACDENMRVITSNKNGCLMICNLVDNCHHNPFTLSQVDNDGGDNEAV